MAAQWASGHFVPGLYGGGLSVVGVSARHYRRWGNEVSEAEIEAARADAAGKVAMFRGMTVTAESFNRYDAGVFGFVAEFRAEIDLDDADSSGFAQRLSFDPARDVLVLDFATLVRFTYPVALPGLNVYGGNTGANGRPGWTYGRGIPVIEGHIVAAGFSQNRVQFRDTVTASAQDAAARLVAGISTTVETVIVDLAGQGSVTYIRSSSAGRLSGFRVLEFWVDPATLSVYTLAVAVRP